MQKTARFPIFFVTSTLCLSLFLAGCGGPSSSRDMYVGGSGAQNTAQTGSLDVETAPQDQGPVIEPARLAALKKFGLEGVQTPRSLKGMTASDLKQVMGDPVFIRRDDGVEIWQYKNQNCILDLFLYEKENGFMVDHSELRGPRLNSSFAPDCFSKLLTGLS